MYNLGLVHVALLNKTDARRQLQRALGQIETALVVFNAAQAGDDAGDDTDVAPRGAGIYS